mmetsp:Transcript_16997/g.64758  ORF Transcript_16997/g.64758 Transcript_16997/m.64758 type:complete len:203 (+) Transcript_16997:517-1125(+)|eukprot:scaffold7328_cov314-Pinguiococcus_pyrenoidosus.AAC.59
MTIGRPGMETPAQFSAGSAPSRDFAVMWISYHTCGRSTFRWGSLASSAPPDPLALCLPWMVYQLEPFDLLSGPPGPIPKVSETKRTTSSEASLASPLSGREPPNSSSGTWGVEGGTVQCPVTSVSWTPVLGWHHSAAAMSPTAWRSHCRITGPCHPNDMVKDMSRAMAKESRMDQGSLDILKIRNSAGRAFKLAAPALTPLA